MKDLSPATYKRIAKHETGHAVVIVAVGLVIKRGFISRQIGRGCGIDIENQTTVDELSAMPASPEKREIGKNYVGVYSAGQLAEPSSDQSWNAYDDEMIELYAVAALFDPSVDSDKVLWTDEKVRNKSTRNPEWTKWAEVDALIDEAKVLAKQIIKNNSVAVQEVQRLFACSRSHEGSVLQKAIIDRLK